jgi:hypothetical protein
VLPVARSFRAGGTPFVFEQTTSSPGAPDARTQRRLDMGVRIEAALSGGVKLTTNQAAEQVGGKRADVLAALAEEVVLGTVIAESGTRNSTLYSLAAAGSS